MNNMNENKNEFEGLPLNPTHVNVVMTGNPDNYMLEIFKLSVLMVMLQWIAKFAELGAYATMSLWQIGMPMLLVPAALVFSWTITLVIEALKKSVPKSSN